MDYASTVWHNPLKNKIHLRTLDTVQRAALIRILSVFRTTATQSIEVEAYMLPTRLRLKQRVQKTITRLYALPDIHPIHDALARGQRRSRNIGLAPRFPLAQAMKTMDLGRLKALEKIDPCPQAPWEPPVFKEIEIKTDQDRAIKNASALQAAANMIVYSDASAQQGQLEAAAVTLDQTRNIEDSRTADVGLASH
jgi:hypothetical protein